MFTKQKRLIGLGMAVALSGGLQANAGIIASDNFESYTPTTTFIGGTGGTGWAGAYTLSAPGADFPTRNTAQSVSLSYSNGAITSDGGAVAGRYEIPSVTPSVGANSVFHRALPAITDDVVYLSTLIQHTSSDGVMNDFLQFGLSQSNADNTLHASFTLNSTVFQVRANTTAVGVSGLSPVNGQTYLMVIKAEKVSGSATYNKVTLFINPDDLVEANNASTVVNANTTMDLSSGGFFVFRRSALEASDTTYFDNIKVGTTFDSVVAVIPEPASLGLAFVGASLLAGGRRK